MAVKTSRKVAKSTSIQLAGETKRLHYKEVLYTADVEYQLAEELRGELLSLRDGSGEPYFEYADATDESVQVNSEDGSGKKVGQDSKEGAVEGAGEGTGTMSTGKGKTIEV